MNEATQSPAISNDEIDLLELFKQLWNDKYLILLITLIIFALSVIYVVTTPPVYKAEALFLPPLEQDIAALNKAALATSTTDNANFNRFKKYRSDEIYQNFLTNLESLSLRLRFFKENETLQSFYLERFPTASENTIFEKQFNKNLTLLQPKKKNAHSSVTLSFEIQDDILSATTLNAFINFVAHRTQADFIQAINFEIDNNLSTLKAQINGKRTLAEQRRKDRITQLTENLVIAKAMAINNSQINQAANNLNMEYMRGVASISAEIKLLKERKNNDPFIDGIRKLQEQAAFLQSLTFSTNQIKTFRFDQPATQPEQPIKPRKTLVLAIGLILGGMLGIFGALIRNAVVSKRRQQTLGQS